MDKHVVSLELSKSLKLAGWKKETEFWWKERLDGWELISDMNIVLNGDGKWFPAPLATEILEELPYGIKESALIIVKRSNIPPVGWKWEVKYENIQMICDESLPNALAKLWLYLKKENLL